MAKTINGKRVNILSNVKEIYQHCFPTDVEGYNLNKNISFAQILAHMEHGEDFYNIIGVNDSLIRERIFDLTAKVAHIKYDVIYNMWLNAEELEKKYLENLF